MNISPYFIVAAIRELFSLFAFVKRGAAFGGLLAY